MLQLEAVSRTAPLLEADLMKSCMCLLDVMEEVVLVSAAVIWQRSQHMRLWMMVIPEESGDGMYRSSPRRWPVSSGRAR